MRRATTRLLAWSGLLALFAAPVTPAEPPVMSRLVRDPAHWTPERLRGARPMPLPRAAALESPRSLAEDLAELRRRPSVEGPSSPPRAGVTPRFDRYLFDPGLPAPRARRQRPDRGAARSNVLAPGEVELQNRGAGPFDFDYSSSRLVPEDARVVYPYSAVGKLFFRDGAEGFVCSGAVISSRVVLTAGHCLYDPVTDRFYTDFLFVPAYHRGEAPYGAWSSDFAVVTGDWANGDGEAINRADFGVLVINDSGGMKIGNVTGWLGYKTNNLVPNHLHMVGFPGNHDGGERMHQVTSGSWDCCFDNNALYGSDMGGGSSGSPWVQNFGVKANGQKGGRNKLMNRLVGVTSFGPIDNSEKFQGSSVLGPSFVTIFNQACSQMAGNCTRKGKPKSN